MFVRSKSTPKPGENVYGNYNCFPSLLPPPWFSNSRYFCQELRKLLRILERRYACPFENSGSQARTLTAFPFLLSTRHLNDLFCFEVNDIAATHLVWGDSTTLGRQCPRFRFLKEIFLVSCSVQGWADWVLAWRFQFCASFWNVNPFRVAVTNGLKLLLVFWRSSAVTECVLRRFKRHLLDVPRICRHV